MSLVNLRIQPGASIFEQLVTASIRALVTGEFKEGQSFPSVRRLAADFKIHPNTAQKVIQHLIRERLLEVRPGIGTMVAKLRNDAANTKELLGIEAERFVQEAIRIGAGLPEVIRAVEELWTENAPVEEGMAHDRRR